MGLLSLAVSAAIAVPWLLASGVDINLDGEGVRVAAGLVASTALYGALGVSIAALIRNQTTAAALVLIWLLAVEGIIGDLRARRRHSCSGCPQPPAGHSSTSARAATASPCLPPPASSSVYVAVLRRRRHPPHRRPRHHLNTPIATEPPTGANHEHQPEPPAPPTSAGPGPSPPSPVSPPPPPLLATMGCSGSVVHNYRTFHSALDRGASCSELYDQRSRYDDETILAKMDQDLDSIGCTSPDATRND